MAFSSGASNLSPGDANGATDVFVRDLVNATTERVSVSSSGTLANGASYSPSISLDGRFVTFVSNASNLVPGDTNGSSDVFVHDRATGVTERASVSSSGAQGDNMTFYASISADGRFVAFVSRAATLVPGDTNGAPDVFVRDRLNGTTERVSVSSTGSQGNSGSSYPVAISADGRYVTFWSFATNMVAGATSGLEDVFLRDRWIGTTELVSVSSSGAVGNGSSDSASITADGRFVAFHSYASNLVSNDTNGHDDIFVRDLGSGTTELVSVDSSGVQSDGPSNYPSISADGRYVLFWSDASNLVAADANGATDVFVHDRASGATEIVSVGSSGAHGDAISMNEHSLPCISGDGRVVTYWSLASNLVAADTNGYADVFVRDRMAAILQFCHGDGSGTPCPCGNSGAAERGCANSVDASGALLTAIGGPSVQSDTIVLTGSGMPNAACLYMQGTTRLNNGHGAPFGDGLRCVGGAIIRMGAKTNANGTSHYPGSGDPSVSARGLDSPGDVRTYQVWYRNAATFCVASTFNLTNGIEITWGF